LVLKKFTLFFILGFSALSLKAQDSYNFTHYGIGFYGSVNYPYADLKAANNGKTYAVAGYYNLTPYIPLGLEVQFGGLSGGSIITDPNKKQYDNKYKAIIAHGDLGFGEIIDYDGSFFKKLFKDIYVGTGIGVISNNMAFIQRTNLNGTAQLPVGAYTFGGKNSSLNLLVPLRFGLDIKIYDAYAEPFMSLNIGYVQNITFGEGLDGYSDAALLSFKGSSPDQYRQIVVGLKFNFGTSTPYTKAIN
jgi:hypothetical protein